MRHTASRGRYCGAVPVVVLLALALSGCGHTSQTVKVRDAAGADSCTDEGYWVSDRDGSNRQEIYTCVMPDMTVKCVIFSGNIATDATEIVRATFSNALGGNKPECAK